MTPPLSSYEDLEAPLMKRNMSFSNLKSDLETYLKTPEGSTKGIKRISSLTLMLGVGGSREPSTRGGNVYKQMLDANALNASLLELPRHEEEDK